MGWTRRLVLVLIVCLTGCSKQVEEPIGPPFSGLAPFEGVWAGDLMAAGQTLPLILRIEPEADNPVTLDSPAQQAFGMPAESGRGADGALVAEWPDLRARFSGTLTPDGATMEGAWRQNGFTIDLKLTKTLEGQVAVRERRPKPQEPEGVLPYEAFDVVVEGTPALAGTITMPRGAGPFPGVVLISGSGPQNRDEELLGHKPFLVLADRLTRRGIAVLRYDERGVGDSEGNYADATVPLFALDAQRAMDHLRARAEVGAIGLIGHSEGGMVAGLVAQDIEAPGPDFLVTLAAPYIPLDEIVEGQVRDALRLGGATDEAIASTVAIQRTLLDAAMTGDTPNEACVAIEAAASDLPPDVQDRALGLCTAGYFSALRLSPDDIYAGIDVPLLALFGSLDSQVPAARNAAAARALLGDGALIETVEGVNHLFQTAQTGAVAEYAVIDETMREDVMERIADFILDQ